MASQGNGASTAANGADTSQFVTKSDLGGMLKEVKDFVVETVGAAMPGERMITEHAQDREPESHSAGTKLLLREFIHDKNFHYVKMPPDYNYRQAMDRDSYVREGEKMWTDVTDQVRGSLGGEGLRLIRRSIQDYNHEKRISMQEIEGQIGSLDQEGTTVDEDGLESKRDTRRNPATPHETLAKAAKGDQDGMTRAQHRENARKLIKAGAN